MTDGCLHNRFNQQQSAGVGAASSSQPAKVEGTFTNLGGGGTTTTTTTKNTLGPKLPSIAVDEVGGLCPYCDFSFCCCATHHEPKSVTQPQTFGLPNTQKGNTAGDKLLGAAAALAAGSARADGTCRVANEPELRAAITVSKGLGVRRSLM